MYYVSFQTIKIRFLEVLFLYPFSTHIYKKQGVVPHHEMPGLPYQLPHLRLGRSNLHSFNQKIHRGLRRHHGCHRKNESTKTYLVTMRVSPLFVFCLYRWQKNHTPQKKQTTKKKQNVYQRIPAVFKSQTPIFTTLLDKSLSKQHNFDTGPPTDHLKLHPSTFVAFTPHRLEPNFSTSNTTAIMSWTAGLNTKLTVLTKKRGW